MLTLSGNDARAKRTLVDADRHLLLEAALPSSRSASKGFFDGQPFSKANAFLEDEGRWRIDWAKTEAWSVDANARRRSELGGAGLECVQFTT